MGNGLITPKEAVDRFMNFVRLDKEERDKINTIYNINFLLCMFEFETTNMDFNIAYLNYAIERFGIRDVCEVRERGDGKLMLHYTGGTKL